MQNAETVLGVLRERGSRGLPLERLYRQLFNPQLYLLAYGRLYANKGAMTPGVTGETVDGMSLRKIETIVAALRRERYRWSPVKRIHIPKKNGKTRPLGLPPWSDKLVGEVIRLLLEAYYQPTFSDLSHGFRPGRGCHTALRHVADTWTGTTWFIEGDVADCFGSFDHQIMLSTLAERIHDGRFLRLMRNMLTAGYLEDWVWNATLSGVPQGGVVSPTLSNIYLHRLDTFVETVLIPEYTRGRIRKQDTAYARVRAARDRAYRRGDRAQARTLHRQLRNMPSGDPRDPGYRRLRYVRYCDDTLLGFTGPKAEAEEIKQRLTAFLRDNLALELSRDKTLITHARTQAARFLGYEITVLHNDRKVTRGRRSANGIVSLRVPASVIKAKKAPYTSRGKPARRPHLLNEDDHTIVTPTGPSGGASSSTTCQPGTCTVSTGCTGSWRPRCSRPWPTSTARRCRGWPASMRPPSTPQTGLANASRPGSNAAAGSHWSHGSAVFPSNGSGARSSPTASRSRASSVTRNW
jgi:group II intron reverse transcriptase/maturase